MAKNKSNIKTRFTNTKGEKVTVYKDGTKSRSGGSSDNAITNAKVDAGTLPESQRENVPQTDLVSRGNAMIEQTKAEGSKPFKGSSYDTGFEPTVISDTTIREDVIPDINTRLNKVAETGQYYDSVGNLHDADGSIAETNTADTTGSAEADQLMTSANEDSKLIFDTLDTLMKQTDSNTASQIRSIKAQYNLREKQLEEINRREQLGEDTALLLGGSSRYAQSSTGISAGFARAGIMELAELDAKEMSAISEAKAAQDTQNYNLASKKLDYVEALRKEKVTKATEIAKNVAEENKKMREKISQQTKEYAIASLFKQGITDPASLLDLVNYDESGALVGDISLKEIEDTLKIINPDENLNGASSDYQTYKMMQKAGEIPEGWNFFDYKTAVTNAGKSKSKSTDDFTEQEQRKLEQKFGADWENSTSRQEQLDFVYGEDAEGSRFTDTQLAQGAANAGVSIDEFKRVSDDDKNEYINGRLKDLAPDINGLLQTIEPGNEDDKKEAYEAIRTIIESAGFDVETYQGGRFMEGNEDMASLDGLYTAFQASRA